MNRLATLILMLLIVLADPFVVRAEKRQSGDTLNFILENDFYYNVDRHYTNGIQLAWTPGPDTATPGWVSELSLLAPWFQEQSEVKYGLVLGQSTFTPADITSQTPLLQDRPYAGWLYGTVGLAAESGHQLDQFGLSIGIVGPASLAEKSQKTIHEIVGSAQPQGWRNQLKNEPGIVVAGQRSWRDPVARSCNERQLDFIPHVGGALGNVFTYANAGVAMRYGNTPPSDYGPPGTQPGLPGFVGLSPVPDRGWYLFSGIDLRLVARNIFLDGNTSHESLSVKKYPFVGDMQLGFVLYWEDVRFSYTHIFRTKEFRAQNGNDEFGSFGISIKF